MSGEPVQIGPFIGGLNTFSDSSSIGDDELVVCENFELDLDGSLVSRPPITTAGAPLPLGLTGNVLSLGYFYGAAGTAYHIVSDGLNSTWYFNGTAWTLITNTFAASAMAQFDNKAYLVAPIGSANPGGYWTPSGGFVADANMPKGDAIVSHKLRLWIVLGKNAVTNGTRLYFSKVLGTVPIWPAAPDFIDVGGGDGQNLVTLTVYYNSLLLFRTNSIYSFQYSSDPSSGAVSLVIPGVGITDKNCLVPFENYLYFMYDDKAYEFVNNRASQINVKTPFESVSRAGIYQPYAVSKFNRRIIYSYWDVTYVFNLRTRTWTTWDSPTKGTLGRFTELDDATNDLTALGFSSTAVVPQTTYTNYAINPAMENYSGLVEVRRNLHGNPGVVDLTDFAGYFGSPLTVGVGADQIGGLNSVKTVTNSAVNPQGIIYMGSGANAITAAGTYSVQCYVKGTAGVNIIFSARTSVGEGDGSIIHTMTGGEDYLTITFTLVGSYTDIGLQMRLQSPQSGVTIRAARFQIERSPISTPFIIGALPGLGDVSYAWVGTAWLSQSVEQGSGVPGITSNSVDTISSIAWGQLGPRSARMLPDSSSNDTFVWLNPPSPNGKSYTMGCTMRLDAPLTGTLQINALQILMIWINPSGSHTVRSTIAPNAAGVYELKASISVPADATYVSFRIYHGGSQNSGSVWIDKLYLVQALAPAVTYDLDYFDGGFADTPFIDHAWTGTANNSTSTKTVLRVAIPLLVSDTPSTAAEPFQCTMQTKNYNYEVGSSYKRLFWWGIEAVFRGVVRGQVVPISYTQNATWSQLATQYTWGQLLGQTWGLLTADTYAVETIRDTSGSGSMRKFVKAGRGLRFRQAYFRVQFDTDGSTSTAPVRLFLLMTYVRAKERVSKPIT